MRWPEGFSFLLLPVLVLTLVAGSIPARGQAVMDPTQIRASGMTFDPTRDGFGFSNFRNTPEKWTVSDAVVRKLFGGDACSSGTADTDCELNPIVRDWQDATNRGLAVGHCVGMSALAQEFFNGSVSRLGGLATESTVEFSADNRRVVSEIASRAAVQYIPGQGKVTFLPPSGVVSQLEEAFAQGRARYVLVMYGFNPNVGWGGGHAVTPFAIEDTTRENVKEIVLYDNNYPRQTTSILVDIETEGWEYAAGSQLPSGEAGDWNYTGLGNNLGDGSSMGLLDVAKLRGPFACSFCELDGELRQELARQIADLEKQSADVDLLMVGIEKQLDELRQITDLKEQLAKIKSIDQELDEQLVAIDEKIQRLQERKERIKNLLKNSSFPPEDVQEQLDSLTMLEDRVTSLRVLRGELREIAKDIETIEELEADLAEMDGQEEGILFLDDLQSDSEVAQDEDFEIIVESKKELQGKDGPEVPDDAEMDALNIDDADGPSDEGLGPQTLTPPESASLSLSKPAKAPYTLIEDQTAIGSVGSSIAAAFGNGQAFEVRTAVQGDGRVAIQDGNTTPYLAANAQDGSIVTSVKLSHDRTGTDYSAHMRLAPSAYRQWVATGGTKEIPGMRLQVNNSVLEASILNGPEVPVELSVLEIGSKDGATAATIRGVRLAEGDIMILNFKDWEANDAPRLSIRRSDGSSDILTMTLIDDNVFDAIADAGPKQSFQKLATAR